ncbi:ATP-dependent RNA helicase dbp7 [Neonectria magnoliae]|uniref:ATP-dependent RNA helicase n=1 Tax=Neonectria magnoliae TaxID=2732573 RepID=A0ABR1HJ81_9HYPO
MADDGMLLNFEVGSGPIKPQVKFKGGRWRDRKQAEKSAREASGLSVPQSTTEEDGQRSSKRQRTDNDDFDYRPMATQGPRERSYGGDFSTYQSRGHHSDFRKTNGQVISKLFSFNPAQVTELDNKAEEWTAPEATNAPLSDSFTSLTISPRLVEELRKLNLERPTAIQKKVIPHMLSNSADAFVQAETGSGKTYAYLLPVLHRVLLLSERAGAQIHRDSGVFAIIVAPTRELAKQTHTVLEQLIRPFPWLVSTAITGGESKKAEKSRIRKGVNFLVATPGRLADHIDNTKALNLSTVRWLILDEGDRLMDLGFEDDLKKTIDELKKVDVSDKLTDGTLLKSLPERRVTVLCSATMKMNVQKLGEMSLADATFLAAEKEDNATQNDGDTAGKAPAQLHQSYSIVPAKLRLVTLISYLKSTFSRRGRTMKAIVFISCADSVDFHYELLRDPNNAEVPTSLTKDAESVARTVSKAAYITSPASPQVVLHRMHGSLSQPVRTATLKSFSACKLPSLLITTDVSSRGLDIPSVDLVIEYDPAFSFADHIHRVGRTARAGRPGDALLFLLPGTEEGYIKLLQTSTPPTPQPYDSILQKGMMTKLEFPVETSAAIIDGQNYHDKAETLQLHIEQRLLMDVKRLELARNGFKSHIRAYATHIKEERSHFDISELHLGHTAKSYGLREAPGGIGGGVERKTKKRPFKGSTRDRGKDGGQDGGKNMSRDREQQPMDERSARDVIKMKSMMLMKSGADEFNIG